MTTPKTLTVLLAWLLAAGVRQGQAAGEDCPLGSLCGQDGSDLPSMFFFSDLNFCFPPPTTCRRVRCENFPPPSAPDLTTPIGTITWWGVYVDDVRNCCTQSDPLFRVQFYEDQDGAPKDPNAPFYTEYVTARVDQPVWILVSLCEGCVPTPLLRFTAVLSSPVDLGAGWFSLCGAGTPGCYHVWQSSDEGDDTFYQWFEVGGTVPGPPVTTDHDLNYCLRPGSLGDLNCDGVVDLGDINPFVLALTDSLDYYFAFPDCHIWTADINRDGHVYFDDINPFVALLSQ
jgi:hypothetical protein